MKYELVGGVGGEKSGHILGGDEPTLGAVEGHAKNEGGGAGWPVLLDQRRLGVQRKRPGQDFSIGRHPDLEPVLGRAEGESECRAV